MDQVREYVASALCAPPEEVEVDWPLHTMGVDSLVVAEIRLKINRKFNVLLEKRELRSRTVAQIANEVSEMLSSLGHNEIHAEPRARHASHQVSSLTSEVSPNLEDTHD